MTLAKALINSEQAENEQDAERIISSMREDVLNGEDPEEVLHGYGLEPDYVFDLITF